MSRIEDESLRKMVEDRDAALEKKNETISSLKQQILELQDELKEAWKHPLSADEKEEKAIITEHTEVKGLIGCAFKAHPDWSLYAMVRELIDRYNQATADRDRYASAWGVVDAAAKKAKAVAEGNS